MVQTRYGSTTSLPFASANDNKNPTPSINSKFAHFGGSELNLSSTNDANSRIIPSRNAASITNLNNVNDSQKIQKKPPQQAPPPPPPPPMLKAPEPVGVPPTAQSPTTTTKMSPGTFIKNFFK